ncbi:extracellular solute-binding protein [Cohnella lupini]|uniref:Carbohydrate ABC transporter substrate-binding protein (CUT1 family) n=1 Tax=Cohnella lupini TaxID=1294267 RepID=A0A3D9IT95_9BACL|nr:extracellular solute-binding protein [Cohnella lupini]RED64974.1 carbohydrate ABC transporter substrate-binding protein (CUT1 family) [Cohnella lupini]
MRKIKYPRLIFRLLLAAVILFGAFRWISGTEPAIYASTVSAADLLDYSDDRETQPYVRVMDQFPDAAQAGAGQPIGIAAAEYAEAAPEAEVSKQTDEGGATLHWTNSQGWVEWAFNVATAGWYELHVDYKPLEGGNSSVVRGVQIDGRFPFLESENLELERLWKDAKYPYDRNEIGMQVRPQQTEIVEWSTKALSDFSVSSEPLLYRLEPGEHKLRLIGERDPVALRSLTFQPKRPSAKSYEEYEAAQPEAAAQPQPDWFSVTEAEQFKRKSSLAIQTDHWSEPYISPDPKGRITYNVLGGQRWRLPGEWVEWQISVPENGWYEIDLKNFQNYRNGFRAYRTLEIDGETPFSEMHHFGIDYHKEFLITTIADPEGKPYKFYLTKGDHTLRMTADSSELQPVTLALKDTLDELADFDRHVRLITGNYSKNAFDANTDSTRTWDMVKFDPDIAAKMQGFVDRLSAIRDYINGLNRKNSDLSEAIKVSITILEELQGDVNEIPNKINDFSTIQNNIGTWMATLTQQPLLFDYIVVRTPQAVTGLKEPTPLSRVPYSIVDFGRSFYMDYDTRKHNKDEALTIWVQRGRDYVDLLREMVDQDFTPRTGIEVNINLMPNPNVLVLGNAAGDVPDVALGIGEATPADFAMRDAAQDLSSFPGFGEIRERFIPGVERALMYDEGTYGLPEVQNFQMLFYRTDIFENLNLKVPDTWEDVFDILPTLQENGMTMNYPKADFTTMFFQNDAEIYAENGLAANLTSANGQKAFQQWTEMFRKYNLPIDIPAFFQHFRDGDIPIGVADFNTYVQLLVAAPEITGHWKIAPLPGVKQANGEVARWSPQGLSAAMIMKKSKNQEEAWEFLKWWTSGEVQAQYAKDIESFYGIEFRWNTANVEAMRTLSWPNDDLQALREQGRWAKNMPYVPGYYFLNREMEFAWNRTVFDGMPAQESLEKAQLSLQREMNRRQKDFDIDGKEDLKISQIREPYEWEESGP